MPVTRNKLDPAKLNPNASLPFELRLEDFRLATQDVYDFFFDVNVSLVAKGLDRLGACRAFPATPSGRQLGQLRQFKQTPTA